MVRKIIGTNKFLIYMYNGKNVRGKHTAKPEHWVFRQWGRVFEVDESGKPIGTGYPFTDYGEMITQINKVMRKKVQKNLKEVKMWRKGRKLQ